MNRIQFQPRLLMNEFLNDYGTEAQCVAALEKARWPRGFHYPRCGASAYSRAWAYVAAPLCSSAACRHQTSLIAGTVMQGAKLALKTWFVVVKSFSDTPIGGILRSRLFSGCLRPRSEMATSSPGSNGA